MAGGASKRFNRAPPSIWTQVVLAFHAIKYLDGSTDNSYKMAAKNAAQVFSSFGLTSLYLTRQALVG